MRRDDELDSLLGPLEQSVMESVWGLGQATVRDVYEDLAQDRDIAYTTVMTTMARLATKGLLSRDTSGLAHVYAAAVERDDYGRTTVGSVMTWLLRRYPEPAAAYLAEVVDDVDDVTIESLARAVEARRASDG